MNEIQNAIYKKLDSNKYGKILLQYALILLYVTIVYDILDLFDAVSMNSTYRFFSAVMYWGSIASIIAVFAKKDYISLIVLFGVGFIFNIVSVVRWGMGFNTLVNLIVQGYLAYKSYKCLTASKASGSIPVNHCPNCGSKVVEGAQFCGNCGGKL